MIDRDAFYTLRDQRTVEYGVPAVLEVPIGVAIGRDAAETRSAQLCALALVNMLSRIHHCLRIVAPDVPMLVPTDTGAASLPEALLRTVRRIDPYNDVCVDSAGGEGFLPSGRTVGLGRGSSTATVYVGASGFLGEMGASVTSFNDIGAFHIGSGVAACLGAAAAVQLAAGNSVLPRRVSFWEFAGGATASSGPDCQLNPIDVGRVWMIGAGAVGSAVAYWLGYPGVVGGWTVIDDDLVELHNTNRSLCFFPEDAGWPNGQKAYKAPLIAARIGSQSVIDEYSHWATRYHGALPDLVLPLANRNGVRHAVSVLGQPLLLHAATSRNWESHLHRHVAGVDDCIDCRLPPEETARMKCSEGALPSPGEGPSSDAALPFLSGAAGLMLVAALVHLEWGDSVTGPMAGPVNRWSLLLNLAQERAWQKSVCDCSQTCVGPMDPTTRRHLHGDSQWRLLDPAHAQLTRH